MKLPFANARPAHTLLYITEAKTFRIDADRRGVMQGEAEVIEFRCDSSRSIPGVLEHSIENSPPLGKKLWILYVRLATYLITLPSVQVAGVEDEVLEQALLFEYESLSGQSVTNSQLAYQFVADADEMSSYWIILLAKETFTNINAALKVAHCKLGGVGHPGGLPFQLSGKDAPSWLRVETWSDSCFALTKNPDSGFSLQIFHSGQNSRWQDELAHWLAETGEVDKSEAVLNNKIEFLPEIEDRYHLTLDGALSYWMGLWTDYLVNNSEPAVPLLNTQRKVNMDLLFMLGGGSLALALCVGHFSWNLYQRNDYEFKIAQLQETEKNIKTARDGINKTRSEATVIEQKVQLLRKNVKVIPAAMAALQQRPMALLLGLSKHAPEDLLIESVSVDEERQIVITGVSLQSLLINDLASNVKGDFAALGWRVKTPYKTDLQAFADGGPWEFKLELVDEGLQGFVQLEP